jgi:hypothetical protein
MPDAVMLTIIALVCGPLSAIALLPLWSNMLLVIGSKRNVSVREVIVSSEAAPRARSGRLEVFRVKVVIEVDGRTGEYFVTRVLSASQVEQLQDFKSRLISVHVLEGLARRCGWGPASLRMGPGLLRVGVLIVLPFWLLGVLPLLSTLIWAATGRNLVFEAIRVLM